MPAKRKRAFTGRSGAARIVFLAVSAVVGVAIFYLVVAVPLARSLSRLSLPAFPDCAGQSAAVVDYLRHMNSRALDMPRSGEAVGRLGMAYHAHLFYDEAGACYERAGRLEPGEWRWWYYRALLREELGDTKATIEILREVIDKQPTHAQAWFRLGTSYVKTQSYPDADSAFRQVMRLPDDSPVVVSGLRIPARGAFPLKAYAMLQLARIDFLQKRLPEAKSSLEEVIGANPTFGPAYRLLGNVYRDLGEKAKAAEYEVRAGDFDSYVPPADVLVNELVLYSRNTDFVTRQINIAVKWENFDWTTALINHILEYSPHDGEALSYRIKLALDTHRIDELGPLVGAYADEFKSDEPKLLDMARYLRYRGEYEASVAVLRKVITTNPGAIEAHIEFVRMLQTFKQYDLGIKYCTEVMAANPRTADIRIELADLLIHKRRLGEAEVQLKEAQRLHQDPEVNSIMWGRVSKQRGDRESAIRHFQRALAVNPRNAATALELGAYLVEVRRYADAARHWQNMLQASPNNIDFLEQYSWILGTCPDPKIRDGERALELADRLTLTKKRTVEQDIRCGLALSAACAEVKQFERALSVAREYLEKSTAYRKKEYADQLQSMIRLFESRRPYRL